MIDLPALIEDREAYRQVLGRDRWIFNKLTLAERLGYYAAPCGVDIKRAGNYVVRPIMNVAGNGIGGVMGFTSKDDGNGGLTQPPYLPGYFWSEWFSGVHAWTHFIDDVPVDTCYGTPGAEDFDYEWSTNTFEITVLPNWLRLFSKHLLVETIGGQIIEASPRGFPYIHGRGTSRMIKVRQELVWDFDVDNKEMLKAFYWRQIPK